MRKLYGAIGLVGASVLSLKAATLIINDDVNELKYYLKKRFWFNADTIVSTRKPKIVVLGSGWGALSFIYHLDKDNVE